MTDDKREELAALEHEQWAHWTRYMLKTLEPLLAYGRGVMREASEHGVKDAKAIKAVKAVQRWERQIETPYADLSEKEKDSDREWADKVLEITGTASPLDDDIIRVVQSILSFAHFVVETPAEATLVRLMAKRGNPIDIDGSVRPIEEDYRRYLEDKEADWKEDQKALAKEVGQWGEEDLAQHEITQFLRYLQECGGHDAPFDLKAHLPRIQRLLDDHDKVIEVRTLIKTQEGPPLIWSGTWRGTAIQFRYRWGSWSISTGGASVFAEDREFLYGGQGTRDGVETPTYDATCTWDEFVGWARDAGVTIRVVG
jgi:hypothetical protein